MTYVKVDLARIGVKPSARLRRVDTQQCVRATAFLEQSVEVRDLTAVRLNVTDDDDRVRLTERID
jgi:hypothetical protein